MEHARRYSECEGVAEWHSPMGRVLRRKKDKLIGKRKRKNNQYKFGKLADLWRIYKVDFGRSETTDSRNCKGMTLTPLGTTRKDC